MKLPLLAARTAALLLILACGTSTRASRLPAAPAPHASGYYVGTIGKTLHIQADLAVDGIGVSGTYYYEYIGEPLALKGLVDAHQAIQLDETDAENRKTGSMSGTLAADRATFEGEWSDADGKKTLPLRLVRVAEYTRLRESPAITATHPEFTSQSPAIQEAGRHVSKAVTAAYKEFINGAKAGDLPPEIRARYELQDDCRVKYFSDTLISVFGTRFSYTGGAHPNTNHYSLNYLLKDGKAAPLALADLFLPRAAWEKRLSDLVMEVLRRKKAGWVLDGTLKGLKPKDLEVFTLTPRGITFVFSPYAVSCYADGTFTVVVPFKKLEGLIDPAGPMKPLLGETKP
ncbi:MAG: DUF3298 domain-containing protein [Planctomycetota bacterium]|nr:DUF3298 domain-containing protein [Planctomycetota bacterium]